MYLKEDEAFKLGLSALDSRLLGNELVIVGQPNNPTGTLVDPVVLRTLASKNPSTIFVVDEAFAEFVEGMDRLTEDRPSNLIVLCSFTKTYAIPGMRLGCVIADPDIIRRMRKLMPPWSVNTFAQAVGEAALRDEEYLKRTREFVREQRERLSNELRSISGLTVYQSQTNFLFVRIDRKNISAAGLAERLLREGMAIRLCENFDGLDSRFFRIAVRTEEENLRLCRSLKDAFDVPQPFTPKRTRPGTRPVIARMTSSA